MGYDPVTTANMREHLPAIEYTASPGEVIKDAAAALIMTDWMDICEVDKE